MRGKLLLGAVVLLLLLTGCTAPRQIDLVVPTEVARETTRATVPETTEVSFPPNKGTPCAEGSDMEALAFERIVYDQDGLRISLDCSSFSSQWGGFEIRYRIENQTDRAVWISFDSLIVNGIKTPCVAFEDAAAGETVSSILYISAKDALDRQLAQVVSLQCRDAAIFDAASREQIGVIDFDIELESFEDFSQPMNTDGEVVLDKQGVEVISLGLMAGSGGSWSALFFIRNDAQDDVFAEFSQICVNGVPVNTRHSEKIFRGTAAYVEVEVFPRELLDWEIDGVEDMTVTLLIREAADFEAILDTVVVTAYKKQ